MLLLQRCAKAFVRSVRDKLSIAEADNGRTLELTNCTINKKFLRNLDVMLSELEANILTHQGKRILKVVDKLGQNVKDALHRKKRSSPFVDGMEQFQHRVYVREIRTQP